MVQTGVSSSSVDDDRHYVGYRNDIYSIPASSPHLYTIEVRFKDYSDVSSAPSFTPVDLRFEAVNEDGSVETGQSIPAGDTNASIQRNINLRNGVEYIEVIYK